MSFGKNISGALSYNEHKVRHGSAELILASRFGRDIDEIGFSQKVERFQKLNVLNKRTKTNTLHLSLSFAPEDNLDKEKLQMIAMDYMERIGLGDQPFLVYEHKDTTNVHLHIVTTTIRPNGKAIFLHNLARRKSEPARKAIELEFGLVRAEGRKQSTHLGATGNISSIVSRVVNDYKFTSIEEFNGILRQFGIMADRGEVNSFLYQKKGLIYYRIDENGYKIGKGVKASAIFKSPTLAALEKKYAKNQFSKEISRKAVAASVSRILLMSLSTNDFVKKLNEKQIGCSVQYDKGRIVNVSFIDHKRKTVFSSEELGLSTGQLLRDLNYYPASQALSHVTDNWEGIHTQYSFFHHSTELIKNLFTNEYHEPDISPEFLKKKRKNKKK